MKRKTTLVIAAIMIISVLSIALISISTTQKKVQNVTISEIRNNPDEFIDEKVIIRGVYLGWSSNESPPVTRSDWVLGDTTGRIYVTNKLPGFYPPEGVGKNITVIGFVRSRGKQLYIEALKLYEKKFVLISSDGSAEEGRYKNTQTKRR